MRAGELRHRVTIQISTEPQNTYGEGVPIWTTFDNVWAAIEPLSGREYWAAQQENAEVNTRIRIRNKQGITPKMRVSWGNRIYDIMTVIRVNERDREIHLMCREVV